jgi:hypothetical protein
MRGQRRCGGRWALLFDTQPQCWRHDTPGNSRASGCVGPGLHLGAFWRRPGLRRRWGKMRRTFSRRHDLLDCLLRRDGYAFGNRRGSHRLRRFDWRRHDRRFDRLDEPRRRKNRGGRLRRLGRLFERGPLAPLLHRCLGEDVPARHDDVPLTRETIDELPRDDFFDRARCALDVDAVVAFEQSGHFLARRAQHFRDFVDPDCCQR